MSEITAHHGLFRDTNLHVDDTGGEGRPVVLIHGWPLSGESWSAQVDVLNSTGYRVITYDRRGFGRSDKPLIGYTYEVLSDDLSALIEELDLRDASWWGSRRTVEQTQAAQMAASLTANQDSFYDQFITEFFSVDGALKVSEQQRGALAMCHQAFEAAALACLRCSAAPTSVKTCPLPGTRLHVIADGPHGVNVSHADEFNDALLALLGEDAADGN
jgi:non-heme chloroperoxidase